MENYIHFDKAKTCKVNNDVIESFHRNTQTNYCHYQREEVKERKRQTEVEIRRQVER